MTVIAWIIGGALVATILTLLTINGGTNAIIPVFLWTLLGAGIAVTALTIAIWIGRLPIAMAALEAGTIMPNEVARTAFFAFSWFPILTPLFGLAAGLGGLALSSIIFNWPAGIGSQAAA